MRIRATLVAYAGLRVKERLRVKQGEANQKQKLSDHSYMATYTCN